MDTAKQLFELIIDQGPHVLSASSQIRRVFAEQRFKGYTHNQFRIDDETERMSILLNGILCNVTENAKTFYAYPYIDQLDVYVGVVRDSEPDVWCLTVPDEKKAIVFWNSGVGVVFGAMSVLLQRMTATERSELEAHWSEYLASWRHLLALAETPDVSPEFPQIFTPKYRRPPKFDLPDYKQAQTETFEESVIHFLLGHELGHVLLDSLLMEKGTQEARDLLAATDELTERDQALCEEMICDEFGFYATIARCLERWNGRITDGRFVFEGGVHGDLWGGARNQHNFEGYFADATTAIWMLFFLQQCRETRRAEARRHGHPSAETRIRVLLSSRVGRLLTGWTSLLNIQFREYGSRFAKASGAEVVTDKGQEQALFNKLQQYREALDRFRPTAEHDSWGWTLATGETPTGGAYVFHPRAFGGVYKNGIPENALVRGQIIEQGEVRDMTAEEFQDIKEELFGRDSRARAKSKNARSRSVTCVFKRRIRQVMDLARAGGSHFGQFVKRLCTGRGRDSRSGTGLESKSGKTRGSPEAKHFQADALRIVAAVEHYNKGTRLSRAGKTVEAIEEYSKSIELNPTLASAYYNRANAYQSLDEVEKAIQDFRKAIDIDPKHYKAICNLGLLLVQVGSVDEGLKLLDQAAALGDAKARETGEAIRQQLR